MVLVTLEDLKLPDSLVACLLDDTDRDEGKDAGRGLQDSTSSAYLPGACGVLRAHGIGSMIPRGALDLPDQGRARSQAGRCWLFPRRGHGAYESPAEELQPRRPQTRCHARRRPQPGMSASKLDSGSVHRLVFLPLGIYPESERLRIAFLF
ncbi:hypothetical protein CSOJ01_12023 [Colletotrichum sojae]|uniref:Uncharacterized protein n=1 Tax=Colletotrichum sojae TaxID=2175907 RepID=A0A8H6IWQ5_9PEZI|nr:hypothetical protein CSOJ01_12023 [Colletotrichum sojae]